MEETKERHGSQEFYKLIEHMKNIHDEKSHDYASNDSPYANYQFAGKLSKLFNNPDDAGFIGRIGEKLYRLANLENNSKNPKNETIEDTEIDICVIITLWMASRRDRRKVESAPANEWYTKTEVETKITNTDSYGHKERILFANKFYRKLVNGVWYWYNSSGNYYYSDQEVGRMDVEELRIKAEKHA